MATTVVATSTSALSPSKTPESPSSALPSLPLNTATSAMTFFPTLLTPPSSPPLKSQPQPSDEGPTTESAPSMPSSSHPPTSSIPQHDRQSMTLPEPSPPLTPPPQASLSAQIKLATRPVHTRLNRRILGILPLGLPPHAETPALYMRGMEAIGDIYGALEGSVRRVRDGGGLGANHDNNKDRGDECREHDQDAETSSPGPPDHGSTHQEEDVGQQILSTPTPDLQCLDLTGLLGRATRLQHDLLELKRRIAAPFTDSHPPPPSADIPPPAAQPRQQPPALAALTHRIHALASSGDARRHLLLAPLHQFTLALFNGGRHIRRQLSSAPSNFWNAPSNGAAASALLPAPSPFTLATGSDSAAYFCIPRGQVQRDDGGEDVLTFWHMSDHEGGEEEAKRGFKRTFEGVADRLAGWERDEVVAEAVGVMEMLEAVVEEIVGMVGAGS